MKIKEGFLIRKVGEQAVVVSVGDATNIFNGMIRLNATGELVWNRIIDGADREELVDALVSEYEVGREKAGEDVDKFIAILSKPGIIEE